MFIVLVLNEFGFMDLAGLHLGVACTTELIL